MRRRGFESHPVLFRFQIRPEEFRGDRETLIFDNLVFNCVHDVAVAYCLAMAEVWVRLPLDAFSNSEFGIWNSELHIRNFCLLTN